MIEKATKEQQLANLERGMEKNKKALSDHWGKMGNDWFEFCRDLWKIREGKLHEPKYRTFNQYALQKWNLKKRHALQLCSTYEKLKDSKKCAATHLLLESGVISESAARELADVPQEQREEVIEEAASATKSGKPTRKSVKRAANKVARKLADVIEKDKEGCPIPTPAMAVWNRRGEVSDKLRSLTELRQWAEDMQGSIDPLYAEVSFSTLKLDIEAVIRGLKRAVPYVVCAHCQGQAPQTCTLCKGRGMISKFLYRGVPVVPEEMKEMREKLAASA